MVSCTNSITIEENKLKVSDSTVREKLLSLGHFSFLKQQVEISDTTESDLTQVVMYGKWESEKLKSLWDITYGYTPQKIFSTDEYSLILIDNAEFTRDQLKIGGVKV